jgi:hypothetical protein
VRVLDPLAAGKVGDGAGDDSPPTRPSSLIVPLVRA